MIDVKVPSLGESVTDATIASVSKKVGDFVKIDEILFELETDKVTLEVNSPCSGVLKEVSVVQGDNVTISQVIAKIDDTQQQSPQQAGGSLSAHALSPSAEAMKKAPQLGVSDLSPAPRRIIAEGNLNAASIAGTGKDGRITKADAIIAAATPTSQVSTGASDREERVKMSKLRQTIAKRLKESQNTAAILTTFNEVDMSAVMQLRNLHKDTFQKQHGVKLGFMSFFVKAVIQALMEIPSVNAQIDGDTIIYKNYYDIGVAVGTPSGLVVPVVRGANKMSFATLEKEIYNLGVKARDGKLAMSDLTGGTFSISNGGVYGSMLSTPIINPPQSGILGMHNIVERPVAIGGKVEIRPIMYLALSYDHRIIDGKEAVTFLVRVKECIEDPTRLLLGM